MLKQWDFTIAKMQPFMQSKSLIRKPATVYTQFKLQKLPKDN